MRSPRHFPLTSHLSPLTSHLAAGLFIWLAVLLTIPGSGAAQSVPGYRMRIPIGGPVAGHTGASMRPPRLTGITDATLGLGNGPFRRQLVVPFQGFGWYFAGSDGYSYPDDSAGQGYSTETEPARDIYPIFDSLPDVGRLEVSSRRMASGVVVRLTWPDHGTGAAQVAFFLADSAKAVLSAQTDRSPPFTALFEPPPGTAFAGMTVVMPGGSLVTRFVRYRREAP
jgi:hypothetical protein